MAKRSYNVHEDNKTPARDASFRSCLCALLIFIAICIIITVIGMTWPSSHTKPIQEEKEEVESFGGTYDKLNKNKDKYISGVTSKPPGKEYTSPKYPTTTNKNLGEYSTNEQDKVSTVSITTTTTTAKSPYSKPTIKPSLSTQYTSKASTTTTIVIGKEKGDTSTTEKNSDKVKINESDFIFTTTIKNRDEQDKVSTILLTTTTEKSPYSKPTIKPLLSTQYTTKASTTITTEIGKEKEDTSTTQKNSDKVKINERDFIFTTIKNSVEKNSSEQDNIPTTITVEAKTPYSTIQSTTTMKSVSDKNGDVIKNEKNSDKSIVIESISTEKINTSSGSADENSELISQESTTTLYDSKNKITPRSINSTPKIKAYTEEHFTTTNLSDFESTTDSTPSILLTTGKDSTADLIVDYISSTVLNDPQSTELSSSEVLFTSSSISRKDLEEKTINDHKKVVNSTTIPIITTTTDGTISEVADFDNYSTLDDIANDEKRSIIDQNNTKTTEKSKIDYKPTTLRTKKLAVSNKSAPVCSTSGCKSAASRMLSLMNHSVDACENFYEFSCGGMQADNADSDTWNRLSRQLNSINGKSPVFLKKFKQFYDTCLRYEDEFNYKERIHTVKKLLNLAGYIVDEEINVTKDNLTNVFAKLILSKSLPFMDVSIDVDKVTSKYILQLTLPQKSSASSEIEQWSALFENERRCLREEHHKIYEPYLNLSEIHASYTTCKNNHTNYLNTTGSTIEELKIYPEMDTFNITQNIRAILFSIEMDILKLISERPDIDIKKKIIDRDFVVKKVSELEISYPLLNWKKLFSLITRHDIKDDSHVQVYFDKHFQDVFTTLNTVSYSNLSNGLLTIYANDLFENFIVPKYKNVREDFCLKTTTSLFPDISSYLYIDSMSKTEISNGEELVNEIFDKLKSNLIEGFQNVDWLDDASRNSIVKKATNLQVYTPKKDDKCLTDGFLTAKYGNLILNDNYPFNLITMKEDNRISTFALEGELFKSEYMFCHFVHSYGKHPYSFYSKEIIAAPFGLVENIPKHLPGYLSMARVGIHLAKEIGRHFDPVGVNYNMALTQTSESNYKVLKEAFNPFLFQATRNHGPQIVSFQLSDDIQLNTKIAENTALRLVTNLYDSLGNNKQLPWISTTYTNERAFFIAIAQEFCRKINPLEYMLELYESETLPVSLSVENMIVNSEKFSKDFDCPVGSKMNTNENPYLQFPYIELMDGENNYD